MTRRTGVVLILVVVGGLVAAAAAAIALRAPLIEALAVAALRARGVPEPRLSVADLDWTGARLTDVRLGRDAALSAAAVRLTYRPAELLRGRIEHVALDQPVLRLDLTGDGEPLGDLAPLLTGGGDSGTAGGMEIPPVEVIDGRIEAATPWGLMAGQIDGAARTVEGAVVAEFALAPISVRQTPVASAQVELRVDARTARAQIALHGIEDESAADIEARIDRVAPFDFALDLRAGAESDAALWELLPVEPAADRPTATLRAIGRLTTDDDEPGATFEQVELVLRELSAAGLRVAEARATGALRATTEEVAGTLVMAGRMPSADLGPVAAQEVRLELPVRLRAARDGVHVSLTEPGTLAAGALAYDETVEVAAFETAVENGEATWTQDDAGPSTLAYSLTLAPTDLRATLALGEDRNLAAHLEALEAHGRLPSDGAFEGSVEVRGARLSLDEPAITAQGLDAALRFAPGPEPVRVEFTAAQVEDGAEPPRVAPLSVTGEAVLREAVWHGQARARGPGGSGPLTIEARHDPAGGRGSATLNLAPLAFAPDGLQPGAVLPVLTDLQSVSGQASGTVELQWGPTATRGAGTLVLDDLSFATAEAAVEGLDLDLRLDRLFPPGTPPGQRITIERIDPGVPLEDFSAEFQLRPGDPPSLAVAHGELSLGGGRIAVRDTVVDPASTRQETVLHVSELDLARLFALIDVEGLSGTGELAGAIPVAVLPEGVAIDGGRLEAVAPGVLRFHSKAAARALAGGGESVDLALRALQNFQYQELVLTVEKPAEEDAALGLSLLGSNPDVLDGYPFRFNISISGNTGRVLQALTQVGRLSNELLRRAWMLGQ